MWRIIKKIFGSAWLISLLLTAIFSALIYLFGDLLAFGSWRPFGTELAKYITIGVLFFIVILWLTIRTIRRRRRERKMDEEIVATQPPTLLGSTDKKTAVTRLSSRERKKGRKLER